MKKQANDFDKSYFGCKEKQLLSDDLLITQFV